MGEHEAPRFAHTVQSTTHAQVPALHTIHTWLFINQNEILEEKYSRLRACAKKKTAIGAESESFSHSRFFRRCKANFCVSSLWNFSCNWLVIPRGRLHIYSCRLYLFRLVNIVELVKNYRIAYSTSHRQRVYLFIRCTVIIRDVSGVFRNVFQVIRCPRMCSDTRGIRSAYENGIDLTKFHLK